MHRETHWQERKYISRFSDMQQNCFLNQKRFPIHDLALPGNLKCSLRIFKYTEEKLLSLLLRAAETPSVTALGRC